jgi:predicted permease
MSAVRLGLRGLRRRPTFAVLTVATLAIGIGATTTVFSLANALFLRDLPHVVDQDRLVTLQAFDREGVSQGWSWPNLADAAAAGTALGIAALSDRTVALRGDGDPATALALLVSPNYFHLLGVRVALGRLPGDDAAGEGGGIVLSHRAWLRFFGGDPGVIGRAARVNGRSFPVVGVLPEGFGGTFTGFVFDVWVPIELASAIAPDIDREDRNLGWMEAVARMPAGMTAAEANAALAVVAERLARAHPAENAGIRIEARALTGFDDEIRAGAIGLTTLLLAVASLVLGIACANVAGLLLAHGAARRRELAVRMALGADRRRLVRMLLLETGALALAGGALGVLIAWWASDALRAFEPPLPVRIAFDLSPDARVVAFAAAVTLLTALGAGMLPALRSTGPRAELLRTSGGGRGHRTWRAFVIAQVAASLLLLTTALLFARTLRRAGSGLGFETAPVVVAPLLDMALVGGDVDAAARGFTELLSRIEGEPGVQRAALARTVPLGLGGGSMTVGILGVEPPAGEEGHEVRYTVVTPGYFEVLGIPLRAGRIFADRDRADSPDVALVSDAFVRRYWPDRSPVGARIERDGRTFDVIGVVGDVQLSRGERAPVPLLYLPYAQWPGRRMNVLVREHAAGAGAGAARSAARAVTPDLPTPEAAPLDEYIGVSLLSQRVAATIAGVLGAIGALLAGLGIYGLMAFTVVDRRREIGIRMAVGAGWRDVVGTVLREAAGMAGLGIALGLALALIAGRAIASMLHGLSPTDPIAFATAVLLVVGVAAAGCAAPLRRALRTEPIAALRSD